MLSSTGTAGLYLYSCALTLRSRSPLDRAALRGTRGFAGRRVRAAAGQRTDARAGTLLLACTVYRVHGRGGQQARSLGQDRRLHEARGGRAPTACASASSGRPTSGNPFIALEISSPDTLQEPGSATSSWSGSSISRTARRPRASATRSSGSGKVVVLITCSIHATEIGATQMALELVHRLATDDSPAGEEDSRQRDLRCSCRASIPTARSW